MEVVIVEKDTPKAKVGEIRYNSDMFVLITDSSSGGGNLDAIILKTKTDYPKQFYKNTIDTSPEIVAENYPNVGDGILSIKEL